MRIWNCILKRISNFQRREAARVNVANVLEDNIIIEDNDVAEVELEAVEIWTELISEVELVVEEIWTKWII